MKKPKNVILVVADSLRYDSVFRQDEPHGLDYTVAHGTRFTQARSAGCWTLPATASMFTGLLPHEHGADTHNRKLNDIPTLAERMKELGYATYQITANVATTHIFGLHRGFDQVIRIWDHIKLPLTHMGIYEILVLGSKPRLRKALLSKDVVSSGFMKDMSASKVWLRSCAPDQFDMARKLVKEHNDRGQGVFLFINLMEGHFPYHTDDRFKLLSDGWWEQLREMAALYHFCNQTRLVTGRDHIREDMLQKLRERQRTAWLRIAPQVDEFVRDMHSGGDENTVIFCSDHGDNFGEDNWEYHFSNVTEAGNRTPLVWLSHNEDKASRVDTPVSMRNLYHAILAECGAKDGWSFLREPERSQVVIESYWYSNHGKTLPQFKKNQFCFLAQNQRFVNRDGGWLISSLARDSKEPQLLPIKGGDPIEDSRFAPEIKAQLREKYQGFLRYSQEMAPIH